MYVVTEYIPGPTLQEVVSRHGPLSGANLEGLAAGVATALTAIHSAGVVHRDLKPANIMLSPFGPRVIDFGIARRLDADAPLTETGDTMGTPSYMAPEGLLGQPITPAADVFTWGCVVMFAATGRPPFAGETVGEVLHRTVYEAPDLEGLEPRMRELVARALAKDPAERPAAVRLLEELTGQTDPEHAARDSVVSRTTAPEIPVRSEGSPDRSPNDGLTRIASAVRRGWKAGGVERHTGDAVGEQGGAGQPDQPTGLMGPPGRVDHQHGVALPEGVGHVVDEGGWRVVAAARTEPLGRGGLQDPRAGKVTGEYDRCHGRLGSSSGLTGPPCLFSQRTITQDHFSSGCGYADVSYHACHRSSDSPYNRGIAIEPWHRNVGCHPHSSGSALGRDLREIPGVVDCAGERWAR